jgi:hypothetical protein
MKHTSRRIFLQQLSIGAGGLVAGCYKPTRSQGTEDAAVDPDALGPLDAKVDAAFDAPVQPVNEVVLVGNNNMYDLVAATPSRFSASATVDGGAFTPEAFGYALHGAYGSGTYVPGFGAAGSYVVVNASGDKAPAIWDAIVYDFATNNWSVQVNADGVQNNSLRSDTAVTDGAPYFEMKNKPGVPHAAQWYRLGIGIGTRIIRTVGSYAAPQLARIPYTHQYDLATARYSRLSDSEFISPGYSWAPEPSALFDKTLNRIWVVINETGGTTFLPYFDLVDNTWKKSATIPAPPTTGTDTLWQHSILHYDGTHRCILTFRNAAPNHARVIDLNNIAAGWVNVSLTGNFPLVQFIGGSNALSPRWAQYPTDKCHYTYDGLSTAFTKITPPATGITGTWSVSSVTPGGATAIPTKVNAEVTNDLCHYTRFFYVPPLNCFAWVAGGTRKVALWRP